MSSTHTQDHINGAVIAVPTIPPQDQSPPLNPRQGLEDCLNEALQVIGLFELLAAFA